MSAPAIVRKRGEAVVEAPPEAVGVTLPYVIKEEAAVMLSVRWNGGDARILLPYISLSEAPALDKQAEICFGNVVVRLVRLDGDHGWTLNTLFDALQEHRVWEIFDDPSVGLSVDVVRLEQDEDGNVDATPIAFRVESKM